MFKHTGKNLFYLGGLMLFAINSTATVNFTEADIGKLLFFDPNLSINRTMSCASCHDPSNAFSDQRISIANGIVSRGADGQSFGVRNTPTISYTNESPTFHFDENLQEFVGGQFLDGRSSTHAQQAMGPTINALEMGMPTAVSVVERLQENPLYVEAFKRFYGKDIFYIQREYSKYRQLGDPREQPNAFIAMGNFIDAFEKTDYFSPYDSKYDRYLQGQETLSALEEKGRELFFNDPEINCRNCHVLHAHTQEKEPFSNYQFRHVGVPANPELLALPSTPTNFVDNGMMDNTNANSVEFRGKFKNPTLRNVAVTPPYMHNGVFRSLQTVVEFFDHYNNPKRANNPETGLPWRVAEVAENIDREELAGRAMSDDEINAMVAFLKTLTDKRYEHIIVPANE